MLQYDESHRSIIGVSEVEVPVKPVIIIMTSLREMGFYVKT